MWLSDTGGNPTFDFDWCVKGQAILERIFEWTPSLFKQMNSGVNMSVCMFSFSSYLLSSSEPYAHILTLTLSHTYTPPSQDNNLSSNWTDLRHIHTLMYTLTHNNTLTLGGP
jgi:hypothetical protein